MKKLLLIFIILIIASCKLFESEEPDNSAPVIDLSIKGGNEISREVTIYLDIKDDSKIDSVQVIIDDSTYATFHSNFDTVKFIVNEFENIGIDEIEERALLKSSNSIDEIDVPQLLHVKVYDEEGNIGESEKQEIVITEFPGWRKYHTIEQKSVFYNPTAFLVDDNSLVWMGFWDGCKVYDPEINSIRELLIPQTNDFIYDNNINDIALIEGSRVWVASDHRISEYIYDIDKWIQIAVPPPDTSHGQYNQPIPYPAYIWSIAIDNNYNVYVGTDGWYVSKYNGADFQQFKIPGASVFSMEVHPDGTLYYFNEWGKRGYIKNDMVYEYNDFPYEYGMVMNMILDADGNVWIEPGYYNFGCFIFDGNSWKNLITNDPNESINPILGTKNGIVYAQIHGWQFENQTKRQSGSMGIATYDGFSWTYWKDLDTPFQAYPAGSVPSIASVFNPKIDEAPNGDIWMVLDNILWRYRPSLGGYP